MREHQGTIVFSEYDQAEKTWYLAVREVGGRQRRLALAPSPVPFDADIGTDSRGRPQLIYERCRGTVSASTGCELFVFSLVTGSGERPVRNANDPGRNDVSPTLWRGRIAWVREYGSGTTATPVVYTKTLTAPRSRPSTRLPGVPQRRCSTLVSVEPLCGPTTSRRIPALELWGDNLALIVGYVYGNLGGSSQSELRLERVSDRSARPVAFLASGESDPFLVGPSFFSGRLAWYKACGDSREPTCRTAVGPWRYRLSTRRYERGAPGPIFVLGFADAGTRLYEVVGCYPAATVGLPDYGPQPAACRIDSVAPPAYAPAQPPLGDLRFP